MNRLLFFILLVLMSGIVAAARLDLTIEEKNQPNTPRQLSIGVTDSSVGKFAIQRDIEQERLRRMIGQMIIVGFYGTSTKYGWTRRIVQQIGDGSIGGVIFMQRNIVSRKQVRRLTRIFSEAGALHSPLISIDQEGGRVQRLSRRNGFTRYPSARDVARRGTPKAAGAIYAKLASELSKSGFNLNFGPVVDLNLNRRNPVIGRLKRSFGRSPVEVTSFAEAFIRAHQRAGVITAVKHFPGHGSSRKDSHKSFVDITKSWSHLELIPYRTLIDRQAVETVMVGHLYHPTFSGNKRRPATLSSRAVHGILRRQLGFEGVIITDDLEMAAIRKRNTLEQTVLKAVKAGNDILLFSNNHIADVELPRRIADILYKAIRQNTVSVERIMESYQRIVSLKGSLGQEVQASEASQGVNAID